MLSLFYVNDLPKAVTASKVACFADDTKVLRQVNSLQDTISLQNDIENISNWGTKNSLIFNKTKRKCQLITRKKTPIEYSYTMNGSVLSTGNQEKKRSWSLDIKRPNVEKAGYRAMLWSKQAFGIC